MMRRRLIAATALALGGCVSGPGAAGQSEMARGDPALMVECLVEPNETRFIRVEEKRALPGATLGLAVRHGTPWSGDEPVPDACLRNWAVSDAAIARLSDDGAQVTIADDAAPGSRFTVSVEAGGEQLDRAVTVADPAVATIDLKASQKAIARCERKRIGEFKLDVYGGFGVTFTPFESYVDYWGSYTYDPASGRLAMTVTGGNEIPAALDLDGTATRVDGGWQLDGFDFGGGSGAPAGDEGCAYVF